MFPYHQDFADIPVDRNPEPCIVVARWDTEAPQGAVSHHTGLEPQIAAFTRTLANGHALRQSRLAGALLGFAPSWGFSGNTFPG